MRTSEQVDKISTAILAAMDGMPDLPKDGYNPHFKSKFTTLDSLIQHTRPHLAKYGLALIQGVGTASNDGKVAIDTRLIHSSGQWIESHSEIDQGKAGPQQAGAAITYAKRYAWSAMLGIAADTDDDGNAAQGDKSPPPASAPAPSNNEPLI